MTPCMPSSMLLTVLLLLVLPDHADAQWKRDTWRTFTFQVENDAFIDSDTGYTNGVRLAWSGGGRPMPIVATVSRWLPVLANETPGLRALGLWAGDIRSVNLCNPSSERLDRDQAPCVTREFTVSQTMYTPDSLLDQNLQREDRPYSGFLAFSIGATTVDAPAYRGGRDDRGGIGMLQLSNEIIVGVTGPLSGARNTQSLAHWTWSDGSVRPSGWDHQLRGGPHLAFVTDVAARPKGLLFEFCDLDCTGSIDERRHYDITPRAEVVVGTYMLRTSGGLLLRIGDRFPDVPNVQRIATTRGPQGDSAASGEAARRARRDARPWWNVFWAGDTRWVPHNTFIEGGIYDHGRHGWRSQRRIDARRGIAEQAVGGSIGTTKFTLTMQYVSRTPEYDVREAPRFSGMHRYASLSLSLHSPPGR